MKLLVSLVGAAIIATAVPAAAQDREVHQSVTHTEVVKSDHHDNAPRWRTKRVCKVNWVHHRRVNKCWTQRVRW
jgi:hypothetical protein